MFQVKVDRTQALMELVLEGFIRAEEMQQFMEQAQDAARAFVGEGREFRTYVDLRSFRPASPEAAAILRQVQEIAMKIGVKRVAEVVDSELAALQLNRIARESGMARILRRFHDPHEARRWLLASDEKPDGG